MRPHPSQTLPRGGAESLDIQWFTDALAEARARTLKLVAPVSQADMDRVHDPLMSPLIWDLGHIAAFEDLWLCQRAGLAPLREDLSEVYDAAEFPRAQRGHIPYLRHSDAFAYLDAVRERALGVLQRADLSQTSDRLNAHGFVWEMVVEHEHQHNETMLQTLQLAAPGTCSPRRRTPRRATPAGPEMITVPEGAFAIGDPGNGFAYDNERPRHTVQLAEFSIDRTPVSNAAYAEFVQDGGYRRPELWTDAGWRWRSESAIGRPLYWDEDGRERRFDRIEPLDAALPVMHVCAHEADAFARWAGKRLPTEAEWEKAAAWDHELGAARRFPWGDGAATSDRANLDQTSFGPLPAGSLDGATPSGVLGLIGDCWEWTASMLEAYPDFAPFPYREYSEAFYGAGYRVLRGGSWATRPSVARNTFRNWDLPQRRQIFAGLRCAIDGGT